MASNWPSADLDPADRCLCEYARKLTVQPQQMSENDITRLREAGFDDAAIHDATQVISYFNYINRIADGLGVDLEPDIHAWEESTPDHPFHTSHLPEMP
jgi:uncharacterized peroxidase-related enzyme